MRIASYDLKSKIDYYDTPFQDDIAKGFRLLSSGHKVVLSILTCCVDRLAEKTILFMDEPENHLHPPLVGSLIRAISYFIKKRNGVAIVSTHSPVILQEVPRSCVWILSRNGEFVSAYRPSLETFGANVGTLTNEVVPNLLVCPQAALMYCHETAQVGVISS